jgi:chromosome segregation ATPase
MSASKVLSDLQWIEEKLLRPYTVLVTAMREAAAVEQGLEQQKLTIQALKADIAPLQATLASLRAELQRVETSDRQRITAATQRMERTHTERMQALDADFNRASQEHTRKLAQMVEERETYHKSLLQTKEEYHGAHTKLQADHDAAVDARQRELTTLNEQLKALKTKHANFLKEIGHVVP